MPAGIRRSAGAASRRAPNAPSQPGRRRSSTWTPRAGALASFPASRVVRCRELLGVPAGADGRTDGCLARWRDSSIPARRPSSWSTASRRGATPWRSTPGGVIGGASARTDPQHGALGGDGRGGRWLLSGEGPFASGSDRRRCSGAERLARAGPVRPLLVHGNHPTDGELDLLRELARPWFTVLVAMPTSAGTPSRMRPTRRRASGSAGTDSLGATRRSTWAARRGSPSDARGRGRAWRRDGGRGGVAPVARVTGRLGRSGRGHRALRPAGRDSPARAPTTRSARRVTGLRGGLRHPVQG